MQNKYTDILENFTIDSLPSLDVVVMGALEMLATHDITAIDTSGYKKPLVVGSGNAEATGRIIFGDSNAVFASESSYEEKLANIDDIDEVVIVSASGAKHAPIIAGKARESGKHVTLITNTKDSDAAKKLDGDLTEHILPKNREPYTYNTSTYMGMILGATKENPRAIYDYIEQTIATMEFPDFSKYNKYFLIVPDEFGGSTRMLQIKFIELFSRKLSRDVETSEFMKHAATVTPSDDELFISFGYDNKTWGAPENRLNIPLPDDAGYVAMVAIGYYVIAQIQKAQPQYFKENIQSYCKMISDVFGEDLSPIVEGNL